MANDFAESCRPSKVDHVVATNCQRQEVTSETLEVAATGGPGAIAIRPTRAAPGETSIARSARASPRRAIAATGGAISGGARRGRRPRGGTPRPPVRRKARRSRGRRGGIISSWIIASFVVSPSPRVGREATAGERTRRAGPSSSRTRRRVRLD